jgi:hypothetical protein
MIFGPWVFKGLKFLRFWEFVKILKFFIFLKIKPNKNKLLLITSSSDVLV